MDVEEIEEEFNSVKIRNNSLCSFCQNPFSKGENVSFYASSTDYNNEINKNPIFGEPVDVQRVYCENCLRNSIRFPHDGTVELLFQATISEQQNKKFNKLESIMLVDYSHSEEGFSWDPARLHQKIANQDLSSERDGDKPIPPEYVSDMMASFGIDLLRYTDLEEGSVTINKEDASDFRSIIKSSKEMEPESSETSA